MVSPFFLSSRLRLLEELGLIAELRRLEPRLSFSDLLLLFLGDFGLPLRLFGRALGRFSVALGLLARELRLAFLVRLLRAAIGFGQLRLTLLLGFLVAPIHFGLLQHPLALGGLRELLLLVRALQLLLFFSRERASEA